MKRLLMRIFGNCRSESQCAPDTRNTVTQTREQLASLWDVVNEMDSVILGSKRNGRGKSVKAKAVR